MIFNKAESFFDLCISYNCFTKDFKNLKQTLKKFGYKTVAVNQIFSANNGIEKKKSCSILPPPIKFEFQDDDVLWLNRLTIVLNEKKTIYNLIHDPNWKIFDIICVIPQSLEILQVCCDLLDVDLISFDEWKFTKLHRKHFRLAAERGLHFEIAYSAAIGNLQVFTNIVEVAHVLHEKIKSNKIIITSCAESAFNIRSPYDVINLGLILELNKRQAKSAISSACRNLLIHAEGRKLGKIIVLVENSESEDNKKRILHLTE